MGVFKTYFRIRTHFYWPGMYSYICKQVKNCPHCKLANFTINSSSELLNTYPDDAPFHVIHIDTYYPGNIQSFSGHSAIFLAMDHMTGAILGIPLQQLNSRSFALALLQLCTSGMGFPHLIVVDADSKFLSTFEHMCSFLHLPLHPLSKDNHQSMMVE